MDIPFTIVVTMFVVGCGWLFFAIVVRLLKRRKSETAPPCKSIQLTIEFDESISSEKVLGFLSAFADELQKAGGSLCIEGAPPSDPITAINAKASELKNDPTVSISPSLLSRFFLGRLAITFLVPVWRLRQMDLED